MAKEERTIVKKVQNAILFSDGAIRIDNVRASYPHLDVPFESEGDDGKKKSQFTIDGMMPKDTHTAAKDLVKQVILDLIQKNDAKVPTDKWFLKNGDDSEKPEYEGMFIVKAAEKRRPSCRNRDGSQMTERQIADVIYGGCWVSVFIRPWYFNGKAANGKTYPKRILANLLAVQFVRNDDPFGEGRIDDEGVFDPVEGGDDGMGEDDGGL
jgi:hypothetical protein